MISDCVSTVLVSRKYSILKKLSQLTIIINIRKIDLKKNFYNDDKHVMY